MTNASISTQKLFSHKVSCYAYILEKDFDISYLQKMTEVLPDLELIIRQRKFTGSFLDTVTIPFVLDGKAALCIFIGIGSLQEERGGVGLVERYRRALGVLVKTVEACNSHSVALYALPASLLKTTTQYAVQQAIIAVKIAGYHFNDYITDKDRKAKLLEEIIFIVDEKHKKEAQKGLDEGIIIADAVNQARHWVDLPPSILTPQNLSQKAQHVAKRNRLTFTSFSEDEINKMGMGGLASVSRGSQEDCALIILEYKTKKKNAPTLCFIGKGITFDSGGLSIKPASSMESMKEDMSGAAAVISAIDVLAQLKPAVNIISIAPTSENLPSGHATKPGDIIYFYNGKTAEIKNTDAEGRLILADALSYAVKQYKPDVIIDLATLTGACSHALGPFYSGLFSLHADVIDRLQSAAQSSGELLWQMPMGDDYKKAIVSSVADICNIGNKQIMAGATTAAHFLQHFVDDVAWAHIDIAGTAFDVPNISYYRPGATGVGVRLLVELAMNWK